MFDKTYYGINRQIKKNQKIVESAKKTQSILNQNGVYPTYIIQNNNTGLFFDENNKKLFISLSSGDRVLDFDDIVNYEIMTDEKNEIAYTLKTSVTGQFETKEYYKDIYVRITINSISNPYILIPCIWDGYKHKKESASSYEAIDYANKIIGALDYIKRNNNIKNKPVINIVPNLDTVLKEKDENFYKKQKLLKKILLISSISLISIAFLYILISNIVEKVQFDSKIENISGTKKYKTNMSLEEIIETKDYGSLAYNLLTYGLDKEDILSLIKTEDYKIYDIFYKVKDNNLDYFYNKYFTNEAYIKHYEEYPESYFEYILKNSSFGSVNMYKYYMERAIIEKDVNKYNMLVANKSFPNSLLEYFDAKEDFELHGKDNLNREDRFIRLSEYSDFMLANIKNNRCSEIYTTYYTNKEVMENFVKCNNDKNIFSKKIIDIISFPYMNYIDFETFVALGADINIFNDSNYSIAKKLSWLSYDNKKTQEVLDLMVKNGLDFNKMDKSLFTVMDYVIYGVSEYNYCKSKDEFEKNMCNNAHKWYKYIKAHNGNCNRKCSDLVDLKW